MPLMSLSRLFTKNRTFTILLLVWIAGITFLWLDLAPEGVAGKLHAIGYGVCHQIASHTYMVNGLLLPLCSRCTGLFLGALSTIAVLSSQSKRGGLPKAKISWILLLFFGAFLVDGINSSLTFFDGWHGIYPPSNLLRLITGVGMGIVMGTVLMSIWNQLLWVEFDEKPLLNSFSLLAICAAAGVLIILLVVANLPLTYYPLAIFSSGSVVLLLSMVYTMLWTLGLKKENTLVHWQDRTWIFLLGGLTAMVQLGLMDALRFALTQTWSGFML